MGCGEGRALLSGVKMVAVSLFLLSSIAGASNLDLKIDGAIVMVPSTAACANCQREDNQGNCLTPGSCQYLWALAVAAESRTAKDAIPDEAKRLVSGFTLPFHYSYLKITDGSLCWVDGSNCQTAGPRGAVALIALGADDVNLEPASFSAQAVTISGWKYVPRGSDPTISEAGRVDSACIAAPVGNKCSPWLSARLKLASGALTAAHLIEDGGGEIVQWDFSYYDGALALTKTSEAPSPIAQHLELSAAYTGDLKIRVTRFDRSKEDVYVLKPRPTNTRVALEMVNLPAELVLGKDPDMTGVKIEEIRHFAWLYALGTEKTGKERYGFPTTDHAFTAGGRPYCTTGSLDP